MATRTTSSRFYTLCRPSSSGEILNEEEKAAENVYIKKMEQEKLEKLALKGPKADETHVTAAKPSASSSPTPKVSTDNYRNYAVVAGISNIAAAFG